MMPRKWDLFKGVNTVWAGVSRGGGHARGSAGGVPRGGALVLLRLDRLDRRAVQLDVLDLQLHVEVERSVHPLLDGETTRLLASEGTGAERVGGVGEAQPRELPALCS